ncbi:hypothetical protein [Thioalkalivibrio sp.]|uniref:hypothetical protein n=1 Tax=Thioalkalivibrio sp. TaxID=2093813 RepID=UPI0039762C72
MQSSFSIFCDLFQVARLFFSVVMLLAVPAMVTGDSPTDEQIRKIEQELSREREQYAKYNIKEKNLLGQLAEIEERIEEKRRLLVTIQEKIQVQRSDLESKQEKLKPLEIKADEIRSRLGRRYPPAPCAASTAARACD